jgi:hypothetical protein
LSFGQVQVESQNPINAFLVRPGDVHLMYAMNKDTRFHVIMECSQDSTFGEKDVYGDESLVMSLGQDAFLICNSNDFTIPSTDFIFFPGDLFSFTYGKTYYIRVKIYCYINDIKQTVSKLNIYKFDSYKKSIQFYRFGTPEETRQFDIDNMIPHPDGDWGYDPKYH